MSEHDHTQLGAYALGALEPDEVREVDEHLAGCAECRQELAELEEMKEFLGDVPPEAFLEGPPADGDLLLQRTLREVRAVAAASEPTETAEPSTGAGSTGAGRKRGRWLMAAAAVVVVAGALGGGVLVGRQTVDEPVVAVETPPEGTKQVTATDAATQVKMDASVEPHAKWTWVKVDVTNLKAGDDCVMIVTDKAGKEWIAGSWTISDKAAREGSRFAGGVSVPIEQVKTVEIKTTQGKHVVTASV